MKLFSIVFDAMRMNRNHATISMEFLHPMPTCSTNRKLFRTICKIFPLDGCVCIFPGAAVPLWSSFFIVTYRQFEYYEEQFSYHPHLLWLCFFQKTLLLLSKHPSIGLSVGWPPSSSPISLSSTTIHPSIHPASQCAMRKSWKSLARFLLF